MKVFVSGEMIRPSEVRIVVLLNLYSLLEVVLYYWDFLPSVSEVHEAFVSALLPALQIHVLDTPSNLQRSLDALDIEGISKLHVMGCPGARGLGAVGQNPTLEELQDFVASHHSVYCALDHSQLSPEHIDTYLRAYLLSGTPKDCPIIIRIHRSDISGESTSDCPHSIFIFDLDPKSADRFEQWVTIGRLWNTIGILENAKSVLKIHCVHTCRSPGPEVET
ncbi:hypothetical protein JVU11DRAFT_4330 [Chiua virens]|nr:hypothetical protein JVU11DRAFT_4330 [Chiua virens]